ncbi:MAG: microviridin/marinostatin family tricyclic proteinase inhibitor [Alphaproteobacteria bacterium]|nr:microviridin/marinostatin family tricyclic proteinase inhibitor [Alphaproteobacteria bacterium]MCB9758201.1 microviridin/marinostatin family tricyclic proteinase inhibitor [Alphaproteobacteria bacterium]MCB9795108.1 microviridin/marinostatin family tricyclic proteinase inhibitor [Alphaproteobacteria bacterium]
MTVKQPFFMRFVETNPAAEQALREGAALRSDVKAGAGTERAMQTQKWPSDSDEGIRT